MRNKRNGVTAAELVARQAADLEYQATRSARDRELADVAEQRAHEQQPLLNDLADAGVGVDSIGRLLELANPDQRIYPVLLDHLAKPYSPWLLEWIGRAFGRKTARPLVWNTLVGLLRAHALQEPAAEGVFAAISKMARPEDVGTLIELLSDSSLGRGRIYVVGNLVRSKSPEARAALIQFQMDPDVTHEITARLSRAGANVC